MKQNAPASFSSNHIHTLRREAAKLLSSGRAGEGMALLENALRAAPQDAALLNSCALYLIDCRKFEDAEKYLKLALKADPEYAETPDSMGLWLCRRGNVAGAEPFFNKALQLDPALAKAHAHLATVYRDTKRYGEAEKAYRHALTLEEDNAATWSDLGRLYFLQKREDDAAHCFRRAVELNPSEETAWVRLLDLLERWNRIDEATVAMEEAKRRFPSSPGVILQEAKLLRRENRTAEALARMESCKNMVETRIDHRNPFFAEFFFELAHLHDRVDNPEECFTALKLAKNGQRAALGTAPQGGLISGAAIARLREDFAPPEKSGALAPRNPVFLVGFPRSGTTLLSQILSSHPCIYASEEGPAVDNMARYLAKKRGLPPGGWWQDAFYPACLKEATDDDMAAMRGIFFAEHAKHGGDEKPVLVDKMPLNMLHAPLIRRVFPEAKFIMAMRHPCDAVLSCYMQRFELNAGMARFIDLLDAAKFYDECFGLWTFFEEKLGLPVHVLRYEDVVGDFRPAVEALLGFIGVRWHDAMLEHDKTARDKEKRILTPSYQQVSEKIYTRSRGRWLRYKQQLSPVLDILKPHAARAGYMLDEA